jgi:hypothetical protein
MIKDAIANIPKRERLKLFRRCRKRLLSAVSVSPLGSSAPISGVGPKFHPFKKELGIVDVNVLYHSVFGLASGERFWGHLSKWA